MFLVILLTSLSCSTNDSIAVVDLKCEYLENPLGIDITTPRLSWQLKTEKNNVSQKAYQILVSSDEAKLKNNIGDLWDTDKVISDQSIQIFYQGAKLESRQKVFWKVRIWDEGKEASKWSEIVSWEMALLDK
ncbi:MAG: alfa-L-rhamnosidase, partial [Chlorobi bacterium]|nr:alfa-L-rhamnosidase [Chlorobiota bacterium]